MRNFLKGYYSFEYESDKLNKNQDKLMKKSVEFMGVYWVPFEFSDSMHYIILPSSEKYISFPVLKVPYELNKKKI